MRKYAVLATNENPKYVFYLPIVIWAWKRIGWRSIWMHNSNPDSTTVHEALVWKWLGKLSFIDTNFVKIIPFNEIEGISSATLSQVSRLYAAGCEVVVDQNDYLLTSDVDMLPLSDYWQVNPQPRSITSWGHNLSNEHYPICFVGMYSWRWKEIMGINGITYNDAIRLDLKRTCLTWTTDQDIITERLDRVKNEITLIDREIDKRTGYPIGRVDRSAWTLDHKVFIDAHLPHDILTNEKSYQKVMNLLHHIWPTENFKWFEEYYRDFKKLIA